ncbi:hypothetical protein CEE37_14915 [candidate division LCP-89 bacterium B3_LCP]|uniref:Peptidase M28 domain-containing protein n=1 Tax=candidate division LCP-89 bacterium B3_LCP TaxID=2012998 RepID=A0A532UNT1_UNCL8|nr:MAG: hypothetical protein CEE37_14915 [candidate division LCP-89 bacterium B3_LCP]
MRICSGLIILLALICNTALSGGYIPVVISGHLANDLEELESLDFKLHARCGDYLIGMMPESTNIRKCDEIALLSDGISDFSNVYQVDRRSLRDVGLEVSDSSIIFETDDFILINGSDAVLSDLCSANIPFRAISADSYPIREQLNPPDNLDDMNPFVGVILDEVSSVSYEDYLQPLEDFITRNTYNPECDDAALYILGQFQAMGLTAWLDSFQVGGLWRYNVTAELTGTAEPDDIYYIIAHHDATAGLPIFPEDEAPGADDDGSGTAAVLECARVLSSGFSFHKTIRFAVFAGNEQGLLGSQAYTSNLPGGNENYLGVVDADMIGWPGSDPWPPDIVIYSNNDPNSVAIANKINEAITAFVTGFLEPVTILDPSMVYADHASFWDAGIPAVLAMEDEAWGPDLNPFYHSVNDLMEHLDTPYAIHVLEALLGAVADLAVPNGAVEPYLTADGVTIDDSQGNNNGQIEYGESILLTIPVINAGGAAAPSVDVVLQESDPYISFSDWQENYGTINTGDTVEVVNAFAADIALDVPDEHLFDVTVVMTSGSREWISIVQMIAHAPEIHLDELVVDDSFGGNGNGVLEPGENTDFEITLSNEGSYQAGNLNTTLSCTSPYITIPTPTQSYGTIQPGGQGTQDFGVNASGSAPPYFQADFTLTYQAAGGWIDYLDFSMDIGDITYLPSGPDNYGYSAYDINDEPYGPTYNWIEIDPNQGGSGSLLNYTNDDETMHLTLPFTFVYYGQTFSEISVCSNGWIAFGYTENTNHSNSPIPDEDGPPNMIAPFWEDLSPQQEGTVSYYHDSGQGLYIIEFNEVRDYWPSWANLTFEVVLYDPLIYQTSTGDGMILFQYGILDNSSSCTVGIENQSEDDGIQYLYNQAYHTNASAIDEGMAILFTTDTAGVPQMVVEVDYVSGSPIPTGGGNLYYGIWGENQGSVPLDYDIWIDKIYENTDTTTLILREITNYQPGWQINRPDAWYPVPVGWPGGNYEFRIYSGWHPEYEIWHTDAFSWIKEGAVDLDYDFEANLPTCSFPDPFSEFINTTAVDGTIPEEFSLGQNYPNPFNPATVLNYKLPVSSLVNLTVYDISGREVAKLVNGWRDAGVHETIFNASELASGIYLYHLEAGEFNATGKMVLMK